MGTKAKDLVIGDSISGKKITELETKGVDVKITLDDGSVHFLEVDDYTLTD